MTVGLINAYSTLNLGDAAIYSAFRRLLMGHDLVSHVQDLRPDSRLGVDFLSRPHRDCDAYVSVGGDIFNNSREWLITKAFLQNLWQLRRKPSRTILFGQTIPRSCHGASFLLLRHCLLRLAAVCVRDAESHARLRQAGVTARLSFDVAFTLRGTALAQEFASRHLQSLGIDPTFAAVLSVRRFDSLYTHSNSHFLDSMAALCLRLQEEGRQPVVLIQSRAYGADNDLVVARSLQERVPAIRIVDPFLDSAPVPSWQLAMAVFSLVDLVVAVRFHTAVLSLAVGRVPYHIYYSNKGYDICQRLSLPGCHLGVFDPALAVPAILATRELTFNHEALRRRVSCDFNWCIRQLPPSARVLTCNP